MLRHSSTLLILSVAALIALGMSMLASTSVWVWGMQEPYFFLRKQAVFLALGLVASLVAANTPLEWLRKLSPWLLVGACVLLALCFVPGIGVEIYGSKRWIKLPGFQFQPSEFAKLALIIALAGWFARWQTEVHTLWRGFLIPGLLAGVPVVLIGAESDVGTALSLAAAAGVVLFCVGTRLLYLVPTAIAVISGAAFFVYHNQNRWARIQAWLDLENPEHRLGINMQQLRALFALGNGGPWGVGLGNGVEKFGTLTLAHSDFIFPVIGEELGLVATLGVILCYVMIALAGTGIALQANHLFHRCLALGLTCVLVIPAMVHIGVTTALLPNDGLPLPFVSYGGTSLVFCLSAVGLLVGIHRRTQTLAAKEFPLTRETRLAIRL